MHTIVDLTRFAFLGTWLKSLENKELGIATKLLYIKKLVKSSRQDMNYSS